MIRSTSSSRRHAPTSSVRTLARSPTHPPSLARSLARSHLHSLTLPASLPPLSLARALTPPTYLPTPPVQSGNPSWCSTPMPRSDKKAGSPGSCRAVTTPAATPAVSNHGKEEEKTPLSPFPFRPPSSALGLTLSPTHHTRSLSLSLRSPPLYTDAGFSYLPGQSVKDVAVIRKSTNPGAMVHVTPYFKESKACTIAPSTAFWPISHAFRALMPRSHFSKVYVPNPSRTHTHARRGPYSTECPG